MYPPFVFPSFEFLSEFFMKMLKLTLLALFAMGESFIINVYSNGYADFAITLWNDESNV